MGEDAWVDQVGGPGQEELRSSHLEGGGGRVRETENAEGGATTLYSVLLQSKVTLCNCCCLIASSESPAHVTRCPGLTSSTMFVLSLSSPARNCTREQTIPRSLHDQNNMCDCTRKLASIQTELVPRIANVRDANSSRKHEIIMMNNALSLKSTFVQELPSS